jgi:hypothetical protein
MTPQQAAEVMRIVCGLIVGAVKEAGDLGVPGSLLYAALQTQRISLAQFEQMMAALVRVGKLRKRGDRYFWVADL